MCIEINGFVCSRLWAQNAILRHPRRDIYDIPETSGLSALVYGHERDARASRGRETSQENLEQFE
jgi:hypothetical protein